MKLKRKSKCEPYAKFNCGNKVKVISGRTDDKKKLIGNVFLINRRYIPQSGEVHYYVYGSDYAFFEDEIELYVELKFNIGDKVIIVDKTSQHYGDEAVIDTRIFYSDNNRIRYYVTYTKTDLICCKQGPWYDNELELIEEKQFTKADLKPGMVVEYRNHMRRCLVNDRFMGDAGGLSLDDYTDDLKDKDDVQQFDIIKVYKSSGKGFNDIFNDNRLILIWERKEDKPTELILNKNSYIKADKLKFKVGDKVRIIADHLLKGTVVTIVDIGDSKLEHYIVEREERDSKGNTCYIRCAPWYDHELELVEEDPKEIFTKADLKDGMVVEFRDHPSCPRQFVVGDLFIGLGEHEFVQKCDYDDNLVSNAKDNLTIDAVYDIKFDKANDENGYPSYKLNLLWKREKEEPVKEITVKEIEEKLGHKIKIVDGE